MKEENWALSIMQTLILDLRNFARRADRRCGGKPGERQEKAAGTMMQVFQKLFFIFYIHFKGLSCLCFRQSCWKR